MSRTRIIASSTCLLCFTSVAAAQWGSDPAVNLPIADAASDQTQPKLAATADGGMFVSWFDGIATGYDVRVQRIDGSGNELLPHQGILVADRGFTSTQDYGISLDAVGRALLAFRDDRPGGVQITAAMIADDGTAVWGALGVQLTNTASFVASPKIAGTSDGAAVVAWTQDATVRVQRLDAAGTPQWAADVVLTPPAGSYSVADLQPAGSDVILSMVHQTGGFTSPRRLVALKLDAAGGSPWGATPKNLFDTGSVQIGNFPGFISDGSGGGVFTWYTTSPLQCFAQHLRSDGSEAFPHNGTPVSTNAAQIRVNPTAAYVPDTGETIVSWQEQNSQQSQSGLYSQKLDATGNRQWGAGGTVQIGLSATQIGNIRNLADAYGTFVFYVSTPSFGQGVVRALRLDAAGAILQAPFDVSSTPSNKSRLASVRSAFGQALLAFADDRSDSGDIFAQNVNCDGTLGQPSPSAPWLDVGNALAGFAGPPTLTGSGTLCVGAPLSIHLGNARPNTTAVLILGFSIIAQPLLGGVIVPSPDVVVGLPTGPLGVIDLVTTVPSALPPQFQFHLQYWISDAAGPFGAAASNALTATAP